MNDRMNISRNYVMLDNGETVWPSPLPTNDLQWRFRYAQDSLTKEDLLHAASILSAYEALIMQCTQKRRNEVCSKIKEVLEGCK